MAVFKPTASPNDGLVGGRREADRDKEATACSPRQGGRSAARRSWSKRQRSRGPGQGQRGTVPALGAQVRGRLRRGVCQGLTTKGDGGPARSRRARCRGPRRGAVDRRAGTTQDDDAHVPHGGVAGADITPTALPARGRVFEAPARRRAWRDRRSERAWCHEEDRQGASR